MGDYRNKARKLEQEARIAAAEERRRNGWCIFRYDYNPRFTRVEMSLGEAIRHLCRLHSCKISWWRCAQRGLALQYTIIPRDPRVYGETYKPLVFSAHPDEVQAKKELVEHLLLSGLGDFRGLTRPLFDQEIGLIRWLLTAPPSVGAKEWMEAKARLHKRSQEVLRTHEPELRTHLLGERREPGKPHLCVVAGRLAAGGK